jgi:hypothetical protein
MIDVPLVASESSWLGFAIDGQLSKESRTPSLSLSCEKTIVDASAKEKNNILFTIMF